MIRLVSTTIDRLVRTYLPNRLLEQGVRAVLDPTRLVGDFQRLLVGNLLEGVEQYLSYDEVIFRAGYSNNISVLVRLGCTENNGLLRQARILGSGAIYGPDQALECGQAGYWPVLRYLTNLNGITSNAISTTLINIILQHVLLGAASQQREDMVEWLLFAPNWLIMPNILDNILLYMFRDQSCNTDHTRLNKYSRLVPYQLYQGYYLRIVTFSASLACSVSLFYHLQKQYIMIGRSDQSLVNDKLLTKAQTNCYCQMAAYDFLRRERFDPFACSLILQLAAFEQQQSIVQLAVEKLGNQPQLLAPAVASGGLPLLAYYQERKMLSTELLQEVYRVVVASENANLLAQLLNHYPLQAIGVDIDWLIWVANWSHSPLIENLMAYK